jgi:hypothetical protein
MKYARNFAAISVRHKKTRSGRGEMHRLRRLSARDTQLCDMMKGLILEFGHTNCLLNATSSPVVEFQRHDWSRHIAANTVIQG